MREGPDYPSVAEHPAARREREELTPPFRQTMTTLRDSLHTRWPPSARPIDDMFRGRRIWIWETPTFGDRILAAWERYAAGEILIWMYGSNPGFGERLSLRAR